MFVELEHRRSEPLSSISTQELPMTIVEVDSAVIAKDFVEVQPWLNRHDSCYVRPLTKDINEVFDRRANKFFRHGEAIRWVLYQNDKAVGRIAAFVNKRYKNKGDEFPVGGIGFFDCIDDTQAAFLLFDTAKEWLLQKNMMAMDGPINFGERDKWWGLLVDGFYEPLYGMNYNPPYYQRLFEEYGFRNFYNQICWQLPVAGEKTQLASRFYEAHDRYENDPDFSARYIRSRDFQKCVDYFRTVYNKAWARHEGNKEISPEQATRLFKGLKPILDPYLVWFVFHKEDPIAMWISIPDVNQIMRRLNGDFGLWSKLKFLFYKQQRVCDRFVGIIYGIVPEYQGTGVDYYMIVEAEKVIKAKTRYRETELLWQGDFNPKMLNISRNLGANQCRTLVTYRYIFNRNVPFKRHPPIG